MDFSAIDISAVIQDGAWGWVIAVCLGLGLAAATGLRAFLPLLVTAVMARFNFLGVDFGADFAWLSSNTALIALAVAVAAELAVDKVPALDSLMDTAMTVIRPVLAAVLVMASFSGADPALAPLMALIAAPTALLSHAGKAATRPVVTATTAGLGNPVVSLFEDLGTLALIALAFLAPLLVPVLLVVVGWAAWRALRRLKRDLRGEPDPKPGD